MQKPKILAKYQTLAVKLLRSFESKRANGDKELLREAQNMTDGQLIRKWMWLTSVAGGPVCFIIVPFILCLLNGFMWPPLMAFLWNLAKTMMGLLFINFLLACYFTKRFSE
jgi:hypothetical protein